MDLRCADDPGGEAFGLPPDHASVVCPSIGGFGCKGYVWPWSDGRIARAMPLAAALPATVTALGLGAVLALVNTGVRPRSPASAAPPGPESSTTPACSQQGTRRGHALGNHWLEVLWHCLAKRRAP